MKSQIPSKIVEMNWACAASFPRQNGSGTPVVSDPETGSWLVAIGTWFHTAGYQTGAESRLLSRYLAVGADRLGRELEGFFVVVIGDARTRETIVLTDIVGSCHCYLRRTKHSIAFSSSSLLLAALGDFNLDSVGCQEFLSTGIMYEDRTFYRQVRKLGPASVLRASGGTISAERRYWHIRDVVPESLDGNRALTALWESLVCAAQKIGGIFRRPVCDLTGGYDSRTLVAAFLTSGVPFSTTVSGSAESRDAVISRALAQLIGLPHYYLSSNGKTSFDGAKKILSVTDGECDLFDYARVFDVHKSLSDRFDISINGSFGEVARGYWWEVLFPHTGICRPLDAEKLARLRYARGCLGDSIFPPETRLHFVSHFAGIIDRANSGLHGFPNTFQSDHTYLSLRMQRWQGRIASSTNQLWPCLSPFLFRSVLETMLSTRTCLRRRSLLIRHMLAEFTPRLAEFPLEHGYPALPVTWRNLHRFWPVPGHYGKKVLFKLLGTNRGSLAGGSLSSQLRTRLQLWCDDEVREILNATTMRLANLVDRKALRDFLANSQRVNFSLHHQWTRALTLEYTLRILDRAKSA